MTLRRWAAEVLATFVLVFVGTGAIMVDQVVPGTLGNVGIGMVFGLAVFSMILAVGPISGAHMNPAVTLAFWSSGRLHREQLLPYISAQLFGAVLGSLLLKALFQDQPTSLGVTQPSGTMLQSFGMEMMLSFILMFVILSVAHGSDEEGQTAGLAIGATVALEAMIGGPISGASMNPARSFGPALISMNFAHHWMYWLAPTMGCLLAARIGLFFTRPSHD